MVEYLAIYTVYLGNERDINYLRRIFEDEYGGRRGLLHEEQQYRFHARDDENALESAESYIKAVFPINKKFIGATLDELLRIEKVDIQSKVSG